jgi:putative chitinase
MSLRVNKQKDTSMTQLDIWRIQAFNRLESLLAELGGDLNPNDATIDTLIRNLSQQPARPSDRLPYMGIFGVSDVVVGRQKAVLRLKALEGKITGDLNPNDALLDDLVRSLSRQPPRPADKQPYASLFAKSTMIWLTTENLLKIAPEANRDRVASLIPHLNRTMVNYKITTPVRQAHFLAQLAHESDRFNALEEYASGKDYELRSDLGNINPGDGVRYKGRGLIQITGRTNYALCGRALGIDLVAQPTRLADPDLACRSAGWYWDSRKLNPDADLNDVETITRVINGGLNGFDDRQQLLRAAKNEFRP